MWKSKESKMEEKAFWEKRNFIQSVWFELLKE